MRIDIVKGDIIVDTFCKINLKHIAKLSVIVAYNKPVDYPQQIILRLWDNNKKTKFVCVLDIDSLYTIGRYVPPNMTFFDRDKLDDERTIGIFI